MIVYIVRHAEPLPKKGLSDEEKDRIGLSRFGKLQANATAKGLKKSGIKRIISSPQMRAKETAEIISSHIGIPVEVSEGLREFSTASHVKDFSEQKKLKLEAYADKNRIMLAGESLNTATERLEEELRKVASLGVGPICVITHRIITENFLAARFNIRIEEHEWMYPASVTAVEFGHDSLKLIYCNRRYKGAALLLETIKRHLKYIFD